MTGPRRLAAALALACGAVSAQGFRFVAFGDQPYGADLAVGPAYRELLALIDARAPPFAIHVGDFKDGAATRCTDAEFARQRAYFDSLHTALVYTPGDNDWYDCQRQGDDPLERLAQLRKMFFGGAASLGRRPIAVERQADRMPPHREAVENLRWVYQGVLFATLHTIGPLDGVDGRTNALRADAHQRQAAAAAWLRDSFEQAREKRCRAVVIATQADPIDWRQGRQRPAILPEFMPVFGPLGPLAQQAAVPVLLVHGDGHRFTTDQPFTDPGGRPVANLWRLEVFGHPRMHAVSVQVDPAARPPFRFEPIWNAQSPDPRH